MSATTTPGASTRRTATSLGRDLFDGRVVYCVVPVNVVMSDLARALAEDHGIPIPIPTPTQPIIRPQKRPCILLHYDKTGYLVLPMATFKKSNPQTWDLLLREVVVPVGAASTVLPTMRDRERFDTEPTWTHPDHIATYIIPSAFHLPPRTAVEPDDYQIPSEDLPRLRGYCANTTTRLGALGKTTLCLLLQSYAERYGCGTETPMSPASQAESSSGPATSAVRSNAGRPPGVAVRPEPFASADSPTLPTAISRLVYLYIVCTPLFPHAPAPSHRRRAPVAALVNTGFPSLQRPIPGLVS